MAPSILAKVAPFPSLACRTTALLSCPLRYRKVAFHMVKEANMPEFLPIKEIARQLGTTEGTVRARIQRYSLLHYRVQRRTGGRPVVYARPADVQEVLYLPFRPTLARS